MAIAHDPRPLQGAGVVGQTIALLLPSQPLDVVAALADMLEEELAVPSVAQLRLYRLGLVCSLQIEHGYRPISVVEYNEARQRRRADVPEPETWPSSSRLKELYGLWQIVNECGADLVCHGAARKTPVSTHGWQRLGRLDGADIVTWIEVFRAEQGDWPQTEFELNCWVRATKLLAGNPPRRGTRPQTPKIRVPDRDVWKGLYVNFDGARRVAEERWDARARQPRRRRRRRPHSPVQ